MTNKKNEQNVAYKPYNYNEDLYIDKGLNKRDIDRVKRYDRYGKHPDPTAEEAIANVLREQEDKERFQKILHCIFDMCALSGFRIEGRIVLKDLKTGRTWI